MRRWSALPAARASRPLWRADLVGLGRAEHECGEHAPPVLVGEEADELASLERRIGHNG